jgi:hypothetical protein
MTRANHGDAGPREHFGIAANAINQRRIVNFFQARRVTRIFTVTICHIRGGGARDLFPRQFRRFSGGHRLRGNGLNAGAFQFRQRGAEDCFRAAEMFHQFPRLVGPRPWRQRNGEPFQKMGGGGGYGVRKFLLQFSS